MDTMTLEEVLDSGISMRKTIWSKRGDKITRRVIDQNAEFDIQPKTKLNVESGKNESRSE